MKTKDLFAEANEAFYKWEEQGNFTNLSDDDRVKWVESYLYAKKLKNCKRIFTPDNIRYWAGDNVSQEQLFHLIADLTNNIYTVDEFRKDLADYFDGLDYDTGDMTDERETAN
jgi:hypothetical protein